MKTTIISLVLLPLLFVRGYSQDISKKDSVPEYTLEPIDFQDELGIAETRSFYNFISNPTLQVTPSCDFNPHDMLQRCIDGWFVANGTPNFSNKWNGITLWSNNKPRMEAAGNTLEHPLIVGARYRLKIKFLILPDHEYIDENFFYIHFSQQKDYQKEPKNQSGKVLDIPRPKYVDPVDINGKLSQKAMYLTQKDVGSIYMPREKEVYFTAKYPSKYVFFSKFGVNARRRWGHEFIIITGFELEIKDIRAPEVRPFQPTVCSGSSVTLTAYESTGPALEAPPSANNLSNSGTNSLNSNAVYKWYTTPTGVTPIYTRRSFTTPILTKTTTYYVEIDYGFMVTPRTKVVVTVRPLPVVKITPLRGPYYLNNTSVPLSGTPAGGVFSGTGVAGNIFNAYVAGVGRHTITYRYTANGCSNSASQVVEVLESDPLCSITVPSDNAGQLVLDTFSGRILYKRNSSCAEPFEVGCVAKQANPPIIPHVVSASATTLSDEWDYSEYHTSRYRTNLANANSFEKGHKGKWRPSANYTYNTQAVTRDKNYNTGTFDMALFNWKSPNANEKKTWIPASTIEKYSPHGEALQERNALNIASAVKMGYHDAFPYLTALNATYESVLFESFEMNYSGNLESGTSLMGGAKVTNATAHAGHQSVAVGKGQGMTTPVIKPKISQQQCLVQVWVKGTPGNNLLVNLLNSNNSSNITTVRMSEATRSGDWALYQCSLSTSVSRFRVGIRYAGEGMIWLDDIRIQPPDAELSCYVYDPATLRLLTVFDGQHFGLYYQYNSEGKLIRKMIETERGIRTFQEAFYNTPKMEK